jgi:hypothetical protein
LFWKSLTKPAEQAWIFFWFTWSSNLILQIFLKVSLYGIKCGSPLHQNFHFRGM